VILCLVAWLTRVGDRLVAFALGLAIGGAAGNLADRVRFGAVLDFVDVHAFGWHFWIFNLADAGISLGALALLAGGLIGHRPRAFGSHP
jgi:lipoprotein signal peptidase